MSEITEQQHDGAGSRTARSRRAPRQARSAATRRRLLDRGFEAFASKGFDGVNLVEDVLEPAGVSVGSFYHQFADKTEFLREILSEAAATRRDFIVSLGEIGPNNDLGETVHLVVERLHESIETDTAAWQLQRAIRTAGSTADSRSSSTPRGRWNDEISLLLGAWYDRPDADLRRAGDVAITLARGYVYDYLDTPAPQRPPREEQVDTVAAFMLGGITALLGPPRPTPLR